MTLQEQLIKTEKEFDFKFVFHCVDCPAKGLGLCDCGVDERISGNLQGKIKSFLRKAQIDAVKSAFEEMDIEMKEKHTDFSRKQDVLVQASEEAGYNKAIQELRQKQAEIIKEIEKL